jgi:predicted naringenin-chalcone synthase
METEDYIYYCELHWNYDSLDAYLINKLKLRQDIVRLPVTEMGCAAGISGIIYAKNFLQSNPGKRAAVRLNRPQRFS